ncbi:hypothetical protein Bbelb_162860 [Branchiostoma belcheri]|nr:hypothetical protein Bbelb_162860 [Branchiostoma belcheri]
MQQGPRQFRFELGKRPRLRRTRLKFIPFPDGAGEEREPVEVGSARDGLQCLSVIDATGASSHRNNPADIVEPVSCVCCASCQLSCILKDLLPIYKRREHRT